MAYRITRKQDIHETLELCNPDGSVGLTVQVDLDGSKIVKEVTAKYTHLALATSECQKKNNAPEALEALGKAIVMFFGCVFGEAQTVQIVEFYDGNYFEMLSDITPFIAEVILPVVNAASAARKEQYARVLAAANKQRRHR